MSGAVRVGDLVTACRRRAELLAEGVVPVDDAFLAWAATGARAILALPWGTVGIVVGWERRDDWMGSARPMQWALVQFPGALVRCDPGRLGRPDAP